METTISLISVITALVAVLLGPLVQVYITKRQISASTVATFRQEWINSLRDEISLFIGEWSKATIRWQRRDGESEQQQYDRLQSLSIHESKIAMLLNPKESDHMELLASIEKLKHLVNEEFAGIPSTTITETLEKAKKAVISNSQAILKREWSRVKLGT